MTSHGSIALVSIGMAALAGCHSAVYQAGTPLHAPDLARALRNKAVEAYPREMRATHRVILTVHGTESVLTGVVRTGSDGTVRLAALGDFGKTVFAVSRRPDGTTSVERRIPGFRESWLIDGALRDVQAIYVRQPPKDAWLERREGDLVSLVARLPRGVREEFRFDRASRRLVGYFLARGSRCLYEIHYADHALFPGWRHHVPRTATITDHLLKYRARVSVAALEPVTDSGARPQEKP